MCIKTLKEAKRQYIKNHFLGNLTVVQLKEIAEEREILVYGDKAQILQCISLSENMNKLFKLNR